MLSEVKSIVSTEVIDLENYRPDNYEEFSISVTVTVGPKGEKAGDNFNIEVCTPKWLSENRHDDVILGKGKLLVFKCDMIMILAKIRSLFGGCSGKDWNEIAIRLSRIGDWEFENYQEYKQ
jgi:hypothetical protein